MQYSSFQQKGGWQDGQSLQDIEYFQALYPESMKRLQTYAAAECDKMDYAGSPIYDEYPDRVMINRMCDSICRNIPQDPPARQEFRREFMPERFDRLDDMIRVLLLNELQRRRCRNGRCIRFDRD